MDPKPGSIAKLGNVQFYQLSKCFHNFQMKLSILTIIQWVYHKLHKITVRI